VVGDVAVRLEKTLIMPFFWATKTRPSAANRTAVGRDSPLLKTTVSWKLAGSTEVLMELPCARSGLNVRDHMQSINTSKRRNREEPRVKANKFRRKCFIEQIPFLLIKLKSFEPYSSGRKSPSFKEKWSTQYRDDLVKYSGGVEKQP
jgi:hypothetical protein